MPVQFKIEDDGWIIHYSITDPMDIPELLAAYKQERAHRDATPHLVHSITNMSGVRRIPRNFMSAGSGPGLKHPRSGELIIVGLSPMLSRIIDPILRLARFNRLKVMNTEAEAFTYLRTLIAANQKAASDKTSTITSATVKPPQ